MSIVLTHSDINLFLRCRRAFVWSYVNQYNAPEPLTGPLALGTRVHSALETWYGEGLDPIQAHETLATNDLARLWERDPAPFQIDEMYSDIIVGRNCVTAYMDWLAEEGTDQGLTTLGVERTIESQILDGRVTLRAKLDVVFQRDDGAIIGCDFKTTGRDLGRTRAELERSYQLPLYDLVLRLTNPDERVAGGEYRVIKKVSRRQKGKPQIDQFMLPGMIKRRPITLANIEGICSDIIGVVGSIGTEDIDRIAYPTPGESCSWCEYKNPCLVASESAEAANEMLVNIYGADRHARYTDR